MCLVGRWSKDQKEGKKSIRFDDCLYAVGGDGCETDIQSSFWNSVFSCSEIEDDKTKNKLVIVSQDRTLLCPSWPWDSCSLLGMVDYFGSPGRVVGRHPSHLNPSSLPFSYG